MTEAKNAEMESAILQGLHKISILLGQDEALAKLVDAAAIGRWVLRSDADNRQLMLPQEHCHVSYKGRGSRPAGVGNVQKERGIQLMIQLLQLTRHRSLAAEPRDQ